MAGENLIAGQTLQEDRVNAHAHESFGGHCCRYLAIASLVSSAPWLHTLLLPFTLRSTLTSVQVSFWREDADSKRSYLSLLPLTPASAHTHTDKLHIHRQTVFEATCRANSSTRLARGGRPPWPWGNGPHSSRPPGRFSLLSELTSRTSPQA